MPRPNPPHREEHIELKIQSMVKEAKAKMAKGDKKGASGEVDSSIPPTIQSSWNGCRRWQLHSNQTDYPCIIVLRHVFCDYTKRQM